jgi:hypothetical protein
MWSFGEVSPNCNVALWDTAIRNTKHHFRNSVELCNQRIARQHLSPPHPASGRKQVQRSEAIITNLLKSIRFGKWHYLLFRSTRECMPCWDTRYSNYGLRLVRVANIDRFTALRFTAIGAPPAARCIRIFPTNHYAWWPITFGIKGTLWTAFTASNAGHAQKFLYDLSAVVGSYQLH